MSWDCVKAHDRYYKHSFSSINTSYNFVFSVAVILFNESRNKLLFVRQFRPSVVVASSFHLDTKLQRINPNTKVSGYTLELCAGIVDKKGNKSNDCIMILMSNLIAGFTGKDLLEIAKEEVLEETGYSIPIRLF